LIVMFLDEQKNVSTDLFGRLFSFRQFFKGVIMEFYTS